MPMRRASASSSRRRRGWLTFTVVIASVFAVGYAFSNRLAALIPYPEWMPVKNEPGHTFGIDVSHFQGTIDWEKVTASHHPIAFVFIRATMGIDGRDNTYQANWIGAKEAGFIRGAYHYYRPHENSTRQFENFKQRVQLEPGDLPPVIDVEAMSPYGKENLRKGVQNWIALCESHYGVKPIVYSGRSFYRQNLVGVADGCHLWLAAYSGKKRLSGLNYTFHQFSERVRVNGITGNVDGNDFKGTIDDLRRLALPH